MPKRNAEIVHRATFAVPVVSLLEDSDSALMRGDRVLELVHVLQREAKAIKGLAFAVPVAGFPEDSRRILVRGYCLLESMYFA